MSRFVPEGFHPLEKIDFHGFVLKKLTAQDAEKDYMAVISNVGFIRKLRGGNWPTEDLTSDKNYIDICWHQREFEFDCSYAYGIWSPDERDYLGCLYFYPTNKPWVKAPKGSDAVISLWVTKKAYGDGFYSKILRAVRGWVKKDWPFRNPHFSNENGE
jgi:hypothetical protein